MMLSTTGLLLGSPYGSETGTIKDKVTSRITAAEMKFTKLTTNFKCKNYTRTQDIYLDSSHGLVGYDIV
jgi:hypothetical protein